MPLTRSQKSGPATRSKTKKANGPVLLNGLESMARPRRHRNRGSPQQYVEADTTLELPLPQNQSDLEKKLNLKHWREYQCDQKMMIETALNKLKDINSSNIAPFWEEQLRVVVAEGELLAGRKSRLHKFRIMIEKPEDVEGGLGIATEDDLKSYWEAQIGPVVTDWSAKSNWLLRASKLNFPETEKDSMPKPNIGQSPAKPRVKPIDHLGRRESEKDPEKAALAAKKKAEQKGKALAVKKAAEERRRKMKEMMAEKRRQLSSTTSDTQ